jgi:hypothetical protein
MSSSERSYEDIIKKNAERVADLETLERRNRSEKTELLIRQGISRFSDRTTKTDGSWTVINLELDTGVPRATLYRYETPLKDFQDAADAAPTGSGGLREELRRLRSELKAERNARKEERRRAEEIQSILVQRLYAMSLAYAQASGDKGLVNLLSRKGRTDAEA